MRYAAPSDASALATSASRSGFLRKQADNEPGAWNRYFFVIKSSTMLYYFNSETDEAPRGVIDLEFLADVKRNSDCLQRAVGGSEHCFRVSGKLPPAVRDKMRPLYLDAESAEDASAWMVALREHRFSLAKHERTVANEVQLDQTKRALAKLEAEQSQQQAKARTTSVMANRVLDRLRRLALSNEEVTAENPLAGSNGEDAATDDESEKVDLLASLQAMESVVSELQLKVAAQQQTIGKLREQVAEHERKQREKALKFVAASFKKAAATRQNRSMTAAPKQSPVSKPVVESEDEEDEAVPPSTSSSLTSALEDPDKLSAAGSRPKSTSNAMALFTRTKNMAARSKPKGKKNDGSDDSPPGSTLSSCIEEVEEPKPSPSTGSRLPIRLRRNTSLDTAPPAASTGKSTPASGGGGLVSVFKKRVTKSSTAAAGLNDSSSSTASNTRGSEEDTVSIASTDDRTSVESATTAATSKQHKTKATAKSKDKDKEEKLPKGWTKHESRSNPGQYFYAHVSGATSWVVPKGDPGEPEPEDGEQDADESDASDDEDDGKASTASSASAAASKPAAKKKKGWGFKLPRKLTIATSSAPSTAAPSASPAAADVASASTSPIEHDESHHEF